MVINVLPLSHMMALVPIAQLCVYRGDGVIMMQGFDLQQSLSAIEKYKVETLWMVRVHGVMASYNDMFH